MSHAGRYHLINNDDDVMMVVMMMRAMMMMMIIIICVPQLTDESGWEVLATTKQSRR